MVRELRKTASERKVEYSLLGLKAGKGKKNINFIKEGWVL
jgi:hypothetical protein